MGKEDLSVKAPASYMDMFKPLNGSASQTGTFVLPSIFSSLQAPSVDFMPIFGAPSLSMMKDDGLMTFMNGFLANISSTFNTFLGKLNSFQPAGTTNTSTSGTSSTGTGTTNTKVKKTDALSKLSDEEIAATNQAAKNIGCDPNDLIAIMYNESGLNTSIANQAGSGNVGLIQFGKAAAQDLGTTQDALSKMNYLEQIKYVEKFYKMVKKRNNIPDSQKLDGATLYAMIFQPARANRDVLATKGENAYDKYCNYKLDINNDNKITKYDLQHFVDRRKSELGLLS